MPRNPEVQFYLKPADKEGLSLIFLQFKYSKQRLVFSFGQRVDPDNWDAKKQRVRNKRQTTTDGEYLLNDLLENLQDECERSYKKHLKKGVPAPETLRNDLQAFMDQNKESDDKPTLYGLIERFISGEIRRADGKKKADSTLTVYRSCLNHLKAFEADTRLKVDFDSINMDFYHRFVSWMEKPAKVKLGDEVYEREKLGVNTIGKQIKSLKTFMNEAIDQDLTTNINFRKKRFRKPSEDTDAVYLTEKEILKLYRMDLSENKRLDQVRDLFVFGCFVGLRFSDYSQIKPENRIEHEGDLYLRVRMKKNGNLVIIPCNPVVLEIFEKYKHNSNGLPPTISNQNFNDYIKEVCQLAGFTQTGRLLSDPERELWECISSHTCRRSFATNCFLNGIETLDIMKVTGHKSEASFLRYIKVSTLDTAKRIGQKMKKNWSELLLRIA